MRKIITSLLLAGSLLLCRETFAQAPQLFNYQGVARNTAGQPIANQSLGMRLSVRQATASGTVIYQETHTTTTSAQGLYNVAIGSGTIVTGTMAQIDWNDGAKYLQVEIDPGGGTNYTDMGTNQLLSVPYALHSGTGTKVSAFQPTGCQSLAAVTTTFQKIANMGTFTKDKAGTYIELNLQTTIYAATIAGSGVVFELRVDDAATTIGTATNLLRTGNMNTPANITGVFSGLAAGNHTVSLWVKGVNGNATQAYWDPGCFNNQSVNNVLVKEYY